MGGWVLVLAVFGCGDAAGGDGSSGGGDATGGGGGVGASDAEGGVKPGWDVCLAYGDCILAATPEAYPAYLQAYGEDSPCWSNAQTAAGCEAACAVAVESLTFAFPDLAACQDVVPPPPYPGGTHGYQIGDVFPNLNLPMIESPYSRVRGTEFRVFVNTSGEESFNPNEPWSGQSKPRALVVQASALWDPQSQQSTHGDARYFASSFAPEARVVVVHVEGYSPGAPFSEAELEDWVDQQTPPFAVAIDPNKDIASSVTVYPTLWLVDTSTMQIMARSNGLGQETFWNQAAMLSDKPSEAP